MKRIAIVLLFAAYTSAYAEFDVIKLTRWERLSELCGRAERMAGENWLTEWLEQARDLGASELQLSTLKLRWMSGRLEGEVIPPKHMTELRARDDEFDRFVRICSSDESITQQHRSQ